MPEWDAIALMDEYQATGDPMALAKAEAAFAFVESRGSSPLAPARVFATSSPAAEGIS